MAGRLDFFLIDTTVVNAVTVPNIQYGRKNSNLLRILITFSRALLDFERFREFA